MPHPIARISALVFTISLSSLLLLLTGGCESMPRIAAPELPQFRFPSFTRSLPDFSSIFPDFSRMMADLFGTPLDPPVLSQPPLARPLVADRVIVLKSRRQLQLAQNGQVFETFPIA